MEIKSPSISGHCAPSFEGVKRAFGMNFAFGEEIGAAVAIYHYGECVVDLTGGHSWQDGSPYPVDTLHMIWSASKGVSALCVAALVQDGLLDLEERVARYWPEFGQNGKGAITLGQVMAHRAGLPVFDEPTTADDLVDWDLVTGRLAAQAPVFEPGTAFSYHATTFGYLVGEVVRRVTGITIGQFLRKRFGDPLNLDLWIGLPPEKAARVQQQLEAIPAQGERSVIDQILEDPTSILLRSLTNPPLNCAALDQPKIWFSEAPAFGAVGDARSLARLYASATDGPLRCLEAEVISLMSKCRSSGPDLATTIDGKFGAGFALQTPAAPMLGATSFGHPGRGGSMGFADPRFGIAFGYVCNRSVLDAAPDRRMVRLLTALSEIVAG